MYTAIIGGRDGLIDPTVITPDCRYICFTDQPFQSEVWEVVRVPSSDQPRRTARYYKMKPHILFETEYSLWIDGTFRMNVDVRRLIARHMTRTSIAAFAHYEGECTYEYAEHHVAAGTGGNPDVVRRQMCRYRSEGYPERAGLWNTGALLRRHTEEMAALNDAWWHELEIGSVRDELSFGYCTWRLRVPVGMIPGHTFRSSELEMMDHRQGRCRSEFDQAEWSRLAPLQAVTTFPADLDNAALEYGGIYADGWLDDSVFVSLEKPQGEFALVFRGMVPLVNDPAFTTDIQVLVDGREIASMTLGLGNFELIEPMPPGAGRRRIQLHFSNGQILPERFPRRLTALLRFIGFQTVDIPVRANDSPQTEHETHIPADDPRTALDDLDALSSELQAICDERQSVIDDLARAARERLDLLNVLEARNAELQAACDERQTVIAQLARAVEERAALVNDLAEAARALQAACDERQAVIDGLRSAGRAAPGDMRWPSGGDRRPRPSRPETPGPRSRAGRSVSGT